MDKNYDVIVVGGGLAGLTATYKLTKDNKRVLLLEKDSILGGRTSSFIDKGMEIESGFHRQIGFYKDFPKLLKEIGIKLDDIIMWEDEAEIKISKDKSLVLGIAPFYAPFTFIKDILGNKEILSVKDKFSLIKLFLIGMKDYTMRPKSLDKYSVLSYAKKHNIEENVIKYIATSLSTGIFFLPIDKYSAKLFFGLFYPSIFRFPKMTIGAYKMGMSDAFIKPLALEIEKQGGVIKTLSSVQNLIIEDNRVIGVVVNNQKIFSKSVILATDINNFKIICKNTNHNNLEEFQKIPTISEITVQIELSEALMPKDRTTFTPTTMIASFTEESRSTFKKSKGRVSVILVSCEEFKKLSDKELLNLVKEEFLKIGLSIEKKILDYRVVRHIDKFYDFSFNNDHFRPDVKTSIKGLYLAGDYTRQKWYSTMEGAVVSGIEAANIILDN